jgi:hypothetical protein
MSRIVVLAVVVAAACGPGSPGPGIDIDTAMTEIEVLAVPRPVDSGQTHVTLETLEYALSTLEVDYARHATGDVTLPRIEVLGTVHREETPAHIDDPNLLVRFGPREGKALLVMAHYDSVPRSPGACDNAAAVAILFQLAMAMSTEPPSRPVILAFTAGEEVGLVGAEILADDLADDVDFAISLDLIGGDGPLVVNGASKLIGDAELAWLRDGADRAGVDLSFPLVHRVVSRWWPQAERSDHGPFTRRGARAVHFYNRGNDGEWIDLAYHSPRDTPSRVHPEQVAAVGRLLRALVATPVPPHTGDGFVVPIVHWVIARWLLVAIELALVLMTALALARQRRARSPGTGLLVGAGCYLVAFVIAIVIERVVLAYEGAWMHSPLRFSIAFMLVLAGTFGLLTRLVARFTKWTGVLRYRALASLVCLAIGILFLAVGAAELAWIWLVPAAVIAIAPAPVGLVASLLPPILALHPLQLREAAWNGFLPPSLPLAALFGLLAVPTIAAAAWAWRSRRLPPGPLGSLGLGVGCGLAVSLGFLIALSATTTCSSSQFEQFGLACERV